MVAAAGGRVRSGGSGQVERVGCVDGSGGSGQVEWAGCMDGLGGSGQVGRGSGRRIERAGCVDGSDRSGGQVDSQEDGTSMAKSMRIGECMHAPTWPWTDARQG